MTRSDAVGLVALVALVAAILADVLAFTARRYGARALISAHTHRRRDDPPPAPRNLAHERRTTDHGPPPGQPERRARHADPDDERARRRDVDDPRWRTITVDRPLTAEQAAELAEQVRRRADTLDAPLPDPPPTRDMRAIPPEQRPWD